jgi:hypothetical protein
LESTQDAPRRRAGHHRRRRLAPGADHRAHAPGSRRSSSCTRRSPS